MTAGKGRVVFSGARLFDGVAFRDPADLLVEDGCIRALLPPGSPVDGAGRVLLDGGILAPGLVDLQVNGGGGVQFNSAPTFEGIAAICAAHRRFGTASLAVTLISTDDATRHRAIAAAIAAWERRVPGFAALHLEGPHIARAGAHDRRHLRPMSEADLDTYLAARENLPALILTLAPECVTPRQIARLVEGGVLVSLGHTAATAEQVLEAVDAGARMATHLFNAMGGIAAREPGLAGIALTTPRLIPSLIADGAHLSPVTAALAMRARTGQGGVCLVSDSMASSAGGPETTSLDGVELRRQGPAMRRPAGELAGSAATLLDGVRWLVEQVGIPVETALECAIGTPARLLGDVSPLLAPGAPADLVHLDQGLRLRGRWGADGWIYEGNVTVTPANR